MIQRSRLIAIHQPSISKPFIPRYQPCFQASTSHSFSSVSTNFSRLFQSILPQFVSNQSKQSYELTPTFVPPIPVDTPEWLNPSQVYADCARVLNEYISSNPSEFSISKQNLFQLEVGKSHIPNSGNGIFTKREFSRGQIVSFYPGVYYPPLPSYVVGLPDGAIPIDLRPKDGNNDYENAYQIHCSLGGFFEAKYGQTSNLALAHLINHPPKGILPNVISFSFYWKDLFHYLENHHNHYSLDFKRLQSDIIPTINTLPENEPWYLDPNTEEIISFKKGCAPLLGMVFITTRDIMKGEELFFDYKFKRDEDDLPSWYHHVSSE